MGFVKVDSQLLKILPNLSGREVKVLFVIQARTKAWNNFFARITIQDFAKTTGIRKDHVERILKGLIDKDLVYRFKGRSGWLYFHSKGYLQEFMKVGGNTDKMFKPFG